jgi:hypothetical protein
VYSSTYCSNQVCVQLRSRKDQHNLVQVEGMTRITLKSWKVKIPKGVLTPTRNYCRGVVCEGPGGRTWVAFMKCFQEAV